MRFNSCPSKFAAFAALSLSITYSCATQAKDDLLDILAQKGVITVEEYEKLKAQQKSTPTVGTDDGFKITSGDGASSLQVGALVQIDYAHYKDDSLDLSDGTEARRARLSVGGNFLSDWQYRVEYEFNGASNGVTDAYVAYTALKPFLVTVGQFKQPFSMESIAADKNVTFMERGLPFAFVISRAPGAMLSSSGANWSAAAGVFGEPLTSTQAGDEGIAAAARATFAPLLSDGQVVHLGAAVMTREPADDNSTNTVGPKFTTTRFRSKPESDVLSQRLVDTGEIRDVKNFSAAGLELAGAMGAASIQGEYQLMQVKREAADKLNFNGWYVQLAYTLTGEARPYRADKGVFEGIRPAHNFGKDGWGAFELAARMSDLDLTDGNINGGKEQNASLALNWYLNPILRLSVNAVKVLDVDGGPFNGEEPTSYQLRMQLAI